jgi:V/A-type H+-transporting ATPase subunit K
MNTVFPLILVTLALPLSLAVAGWKGRAAASGGGPRGARHWIGGQVLVFAVVYLVALGWAVGGARGADAPAAGETPAAAAGRTSGLSVGDGLAVLGIALATAVSVLGAGYAVGVVGAAALGAITEKPELFGRTLIFIGLAEGLAIYGLIVSILLLGHLR